MDTTDKPETLQSPQKEAAGEDFANLFAKSLQELEEGELVKGRVVRISEGLVMVDIGHKSEGVVPLREFLKKDGSTGVNVGDDVSLLLVKWEDEKGMVLLSKARADQMKVWEDIHESQQKGNPLSGTVIKAVNGGFHVDIGGITAFLPNSQADLKPVKDNAGFIGSTSRFMVIKYNRHKQNVIVSRRALLEEERERLKKVTLEKLSDGAVLEGTVKNLTDYGAFVDLGGIDGLVHLSDLSWGKLTHPSQAVKIGDKIQVKVLRYDKVEGKVSLGFKQTKSDPWLTAKEKYPAGTRLSGRVTNIMDYGAFVEVEQGLEGLVHVSDMAWTKVKHPSQKLKTGDAVDVMVLNVDAGTKRISLGLKQVEPNPWTDISTRYPKGAKITGVVKNITNFGVFIGVEDGIDGLVHISDISWKKIKHPSELFSKGQTIEAVVAGIDEETRRFSLSTKLLEKNPWEDVDVRYRPGIIVDGRVTAVAEFGAFVEIEEGVEGLVHISELTRGSKKGVSVQPGDRVTVEVLNVNRDEKKIGLSIRNIVKDAPEITKDSAEGNHPGHPPK